MRDIKFRAFEARCKEITDKGMEKIMGHFNEIQKKINNPNP